MQININGTKIVTTIILALVGGTATWAWQVQSRLAVLEANADTTSRVQTLEELIFPIAVEFKLRERMREDGILKDIFDSKDESSPPSPSPLISDINENEKATKFTPEKLRAKEEDRIRSMIEQRPLEDVRNRRGKPIKFNKRKD